MDFVHEHIQAVHSTMGHCHSMPSHRHVQGWTPSVQICTLVEGYPCDAPRYQMGSRRCLRTLEFDAPICIEWNVELASCLNISNDTSLQQVQPISTYITNHWSDVSLGIPLTRFTPPSLNCCQISHKRTIPAFRISLICTVYISPFRYLHVRIYNMIIAPKMGWEYSVRREE